MGRREVLLRFHRHRLRREDLEDCFSQATLELLVQAKGGRVFASRQHIANALEQRFLSRVVDRRRAIAGRSPGQAALEGAMSLVGEEQGPVEVHDRRAEVEALVLMRQDLRLLQTLSRELSPDQRLVLASQVGMQLAPSEFCRIHGWSSEKYRKVAQRGRARLRRLMAGEPAVPSGRRLSEDEVGTLP